MRDFSRQENFVPENIQELNVSVIGTGAIGRQVALQLGSIGIQNIELFDFDMVEETNITTQGFNRFDIGSHKVLSVKTYIDAIDKAIKVKAITDRWRPKYHLNSHPDVVFCCVDSISTREKIWKFLKNKVKLFVDGRMSGEVMRIFPVVPSESDYYEKQFFPEEETHGNSCTTQATIYCASMAAALMVNQLTKFGRGIPLSPEISVNLLADTLYVPSNNDIERTLNETT